MPAKYIKSYDKKQYIANKINKCEEKSFKQVPTKYKYKFINIA
jgi:hypothetical protein